MSADHTATVEVDPVARSVRVTTPRQTVTLTYTSRGRWEWIGTHGAAGVSARVAARAIEDLVPDARALLRAAVAGLTPAAQATALEGL
jgi:hypothetical protein